MAKGQVFPSLEEAFEEMESWRRAEDEQGEGYILVDQTDTVTKVISIPEEEDLEKVKEIRINGSRKMWSKKHLLPTKTRIAGPSKLAFTSAELRALRAEEEKGSAESK